MTALVIAFFINPMLIRWLKIKQGKGQPIRSDGPQRHNCRKSRHAHHGGILILIPWLGSTLLWAQLSNRYVWIVLLGLWPMACWLSRRLLQGDQAHFRRDFRPLARCIEFAIAFLATADHAGRGQAFGRAGHSFIKTALLAGSVLHFDRRVRHRRRANAVNFTDGLDGLAIVPVIIAAMTFTLIVYLVGNEKFAAICSCLLSFPR